MSVTVVYVSSGIETLHCIHNYVDVVQLSPLRIQEVCCDTTSRSIQHGRELRQPDRYSRKLACGATSQDDLFDRIARHFRIGIRIERDDWFRWCRPFDHRRVTSPCLNLLSRLERRSSVNLAHGWVHSLVSRDRNAFQMDSGELGRLWLRESREMAKGHEGKGHLAVRVDIKQSVHLLVYESADHLGRHSKSRGDGQQIG